MKTRMALSLLAFAALAPLAFAQSNPLYIQFSPGAVKGALYKPDKGPAPHVAILIMHRTANVMTHIGTTELSRRGFLVMGMNPRSDNNETNVLYDDIVQDVKSGIEFLRKQPGITKVLLFGHSGGGSTMASYQAAAEKGPAYCQGPNKVLACGNEVAGLPPADGLLIVDSHPGIPVSTLRDLNPAVVKEGDPIQVKADLDPFNPQNGYNPKGSKYSEQFQQVYFKAQAERMNRLIDLAQGKLAKIQQGKYLFPDDDVFLVVRGAGTRLMALDTSIDHRTRQPQKLLQNDGTVVKQIVESIRRPVPLTEKPNASFADGAMLLTARSFLSSYAVRATNSLDGIDDCSANSSIPCALRHISVPVLIEAMQAHYFVRDSEIYYDAAASKDKDYVVVEGAVHAIIPCTACEKTPGQYANSTKNAFDYIQKWVNERF